MDSPSSRPPESSSRPPESALTRGMREGAGAGAPAGAGAGAGEGGASTAGTPSKATWSMYTIDGYDGTRIHVVRPSD